MAVFSFCSRPPGPCWWHGGSRKAARRLSPPHSSSGSESRKKPLNQRAVKRIDLMVMEDRATRFGLERRTFLGCIAVLQIDGADPRYPDQFREVGQSDRPVRAGTPCDPSRRLARLLGVSSSILKRRPQWRCGFTCYLSRQPHALRLREIEPGREQGGGWMSGRMFPPFATTDPRGVSYHGSRQCRVPAGRVSTGKQARRPPPSPGARGGCPSRRPRPGRRR